MRYPIQWLAITNLAHSSAKGMDESPVQCIHDTG